MKKPLITLIVCSYNQENFIRESLEGALSQTYSPMEIILSDDCSTDQTFKIMQDFVEKYRGTHKIVLNRNESNLGLIAHVNKVLNMATGDIIIGSAGDDICLPHRAEVIAKHYLKRNGAPTLFHGDVLQIGPDGEDLGLLEAPWGRDGISLKETALRNSLYIGASSTFTRNLLDQFPDIKHEKAYEDLVWGFRAALADAVVFVDEPLVKYRVGVGISWKLHQHNDEQIESMIQAEIRKLEVYNDVLAQRLDDVRSFDDDSLRNQLEPLLRENIALSAVKTMLFSKSSGRLSAFLRNPLLFMKGFKNYRKSLKRLNRAASRTPQA